MRAAAAGYDIFASTGRALMHGIAKHPLDCAVGSLAAALAFMILLNSLWLQAGPHPAPLLTSAKVSAAAKEATGAIDRAERPKVAERAAEPPVEKVARPRAQVLADLQQELSRRGFYDGPIDGVYGAKMQSAIRAFEQAAGVRLGGEPNEALLAAVRGSSTRAEQPKAPLKAARKLETPPPGLSQGRITAVQRALTDFGFGPVKVTGAFDQQTKTAIEKFERERKLPVRGHLSDRFLRELAAVTGRPIE